MDFKLLKKLYKKAMSRKAEKPVEKKETAQSVKPAVLPLAPPFLDENGRYDVKRAKAWQRLKLRPRWFHRSKFMVETADIQTGSRWRFDTYERPESDKRLKGRKALRAAKREKVRQMKAAQL